MEVVCESVPCGWGGREGGGREKCGWRGEVSGSDFVVIYILCSATGLVWAFFGLDLLLTETGLFKEPASKNRYIN